MLRYKLNEGKIECCEYCPNVNKNNFPLYKNVNLKSSFFSHLSSSTEYSKKFDKLYQVNGEKLTNLFRMN